MHLLVARHRRVERRCDLADERQCDVGEHHAPAVGRGRRIALDDPDAVAGVVPLHQVREEESGGAAADDPDVHMAPRSRASRARVSVIVSRNCRLRILPTGLNGNSVTSSSRSGSLKLAMFCCLRNAISSSKVRVSALLRDDERARLLAEHRIGHRHQRHGLYLRVREDQILHLLAADLLAAAIDQVLLAPFREDVAPLLTHDVAHAVEAVRR